MSSAVSFRDGRQLVLVLRCRTRSSLFKSALNAVIRCVKTSFFQHDSTGRSPAEEIVEGVLLKMKNEHEERKARFYGQLFTNVSFDPNCSPAEANYLLHVMDRVTFLQLSLVS